MSGRRRRLSFALGLVAAAMLVATVTPLPSFLARAWAVRGAPRKADVIVVLGGGVVWPGELQCGSLQRLQHGVRLYHQGFAPRLILSGASAGKEAVPPEAEIMRETALRMGVQAEDVVVEPRALRTHDNGLGVAAIMHRQGWRSALLVTDALHMRRARMVFERLGIETFPAPSSTAAVAFTTPGQGLAALEETGYEVAATLFYRLRGWV